MTRPTEHLLRSLAGHLEQQTTAAGTDLNEQSTIVLDAITGALRLTADQFMHEREDQEAKLGVQNNG